MPVTATSPERVTTRWMVISFLVRVPVLSEQMTEAEPRVSTDDSFLTMACLAAMRWTPRARTTDSIAGRPSGTAATASDTPSSRTWTQVARLPDVGGHQDRRHDHHGDDDHGQAEHPPDQVNLALQRGALLLGAAEQG